jgi:MSHA pilin protein MshD
MCTSRHLGFSLVELLISIVIMGVGLAGLMSVIPFAIRSSADPLITKQALTIAEGLLNEISSKPFSNPTNGFAGAATQANRALFDDVSDYNGYSSVGAYAIAGGAPIAGLTNYNVSVSVAGTALSGATAVDSLLITVTVTYPGGTSVSVSTYRLNYG